MLTLTKEQRDIVLYLESPEGEAWSKGRSALVDASRHARGVFAEIKDDVLSPDPSFMLFSAGPGEDLYYCSISCICPDCLAWDEYFGLAE